MEQKTRRYRFIPRQLDNLFFQQVQADFVINISPTVESTIYHQLNVVLRCRVGDMVEIILPINWSENRTFRLIQTKIVAIGKKVIQLQVLLDQTNQEAQSTDYSVAICLPKNNDKLSLMIQKAVELGAQNILCLKSEYSNYPHQPKIDRLQEIIYEAVEQSERSTLPKLEFINHFKEFLAAKAGDLMVAYERSGAEVKSLLSIDELQGKCLLIGPEGGFSQLEKDLFDKHSIQKFHLGKNILRTETAMILACGIFSLKLQQ